MASNASTWAKALLIMALGCVSANATSMPLSPAITPEIVIYSDTLAQGFFDFSFPLGSNIIDFHFDAITFNGTAAIFSALVPFGALR